MSAEHTLTPTGYIQHHLSFLVKDGATPFWSYHLDTIATSVILGVLTFGFLAWVVSGATSGVPGKRQAAVELIVDFVNEQARSIFHGDIRFIAPLALTVFVWVFFMNAMDFLPIDLMAELVYKPLGLEYWRSVPTADVNTTFALALTVWVLMIFFAIKVKGVGGFVHELFCAPFGGNPVLWPFNFVFNLVEYISKPLSHSLRLYGNIYAGEIIFMLLGLWAATGVAGTVFGGILSAGWAIFHILIVGLQAFIFMMLTIVYIAMAHEGH
jgi:F-type H+-transporting ATPase subunit a